MDTTDTVTATQTENEKGTHPLVVALYQSDLDDLARLVAARNAARPAGARKVSRSAVVRQLIREASNPAAMTEETHER